MTLQEQILNDIKRKRIRKDFLIKKERNEYDILIWHWEDEREKERERKRVKREREWEGNRGREKDMMRVKSRFEKGKASFWRFWHW